MTDHTEDFAQEVQEVTNNGIQSPIIEDQEERIAKLQAKIDMLPPMSDRESGIYWRSIELIKEFWYGLLAWNPEEDEGLILEMDMRLRSLRNRELLEVAHTYLTQTLKTAKKATKIPSYSYTGETRTRDDLEARLSEAIALNNKELYNALDEVCAFEESGTWQEILNLFTDANTWIGEAKEDPLALSELLPLLPDAMPFIRHRLQTNPELSNFIQFAREDDTGWSHLSKAISAGIMATQQPIDEVTETVKEIRDMIPKLAVKNDVHALDFPLDKVNSNIWKLLESDTGRQLQIGVEKTGSRKPINIIYSIDFDDVEQSISVSRKLEPFDKRVHVAAASLHANGHEEFTIGQIYNAMGYDGKPGAANVKQIDDCLSKMSRAHVVLDNIQESKEYKGYVHFRYDGSLLPMERVTRIVKGQVVDGIIHLFREPPMYTFAKQRKQLTTIERKVLQSPLSKTSENLRIEDYLIERVSHASNGRLSCKILYDTIWKNAQITTTKQKQRGKEKVKKLMEHYKSCGFIANYKEQQDGVTITLP